jgi:hypothetical protein
MEVDAARRGDALEAHGPIGRLLQRPRRRHGLALGANETGWVKRSANELVRGEGETEGCPCASADKVASRRLRSSPRLSSALGARCTQGIPHARRTARPRRVHGFSVRPRTVAQQ